MNEEIEEGRRERMGSIGGRERGRGREEEVEVVDENKEERSSRRKKSWKER